MIKFKKKMMNYKRRMRKFLLNKVFNILSINEIPTEKLTEEEKIKSLLSKLRPVTSGKEFIRLGPNGDGGYLIPDDLSGIYACFSPGVGNKTGFEIECANMEIEVFLADKTIDKIRNSHKRFNFMKKNIGNTSNEEFMTLDDWVSSSVPESYNELILQLDIEGMEYEVLSSATDKLLKRFRIIVVEFHDLDQLWNKAFFNIMSNVFDKLLQTHRCVHNHPNNANPSIKIGDLEIPQTTELTFLRKDRINNSKFVNTFPHPLDCDNTKNKPLYLPKCWYI